MIRLKTILVVLLLISVSLFANSSEDLIFVDINTYNAASDNGEEKSETSKSSILVKSISNQNGIINDKIFSEIEPVIGDNFEAFSEILGNIQPFGTYIQTMISQYDSTIVNLKSQIAEEILKGVGEIENRSYRTGELNSDNTPTTDALNRRKEAKDSYIEEKNDSLKELIKVTDAEFRPIIQQRFDLYLELIADLESRKFSAESSSGELEISKLGYDGENGRWHLSFKIPPYEFPDTEFIIDYHSLSGLEVESNTIENKVAFESYNQYASYYDNKLDQFNDYYTANVKFGIETLAEQGLYRIVLDNSITITDRLAGEIIKEVVIEGGRSQWMKLSDLNYDGTIEKHPWLQESRSVSLKVKEEIQRSERKEKISHLLSSFYFGGSIQAGLGVSNIGVDNTDTITADYSPLIGATIFGRFISDSWEFGINASGDFQFLDDFSTHYDFLLSGGYRLDETGVLGLNLGYTDDVNNLDDEHLKIQLFYGANWIDTENRVISTAKNGEGIRFYLDIIPRIVLRLALEINITKTPIMVSNK